MREPMFIGGERLMSEREWKALGMAFRDGAKPHPQIRLPAGSRGTIFGDHPEIENAKWVVVNIDNLQEVEDRDFIAFFREYWQVPSGASGITVGAVVKYNGILYANPSFRKYWGAANIFGRGPGNETAPYKVLARVE